MPDKQKIKLDREELRAFLADELEVPVEDVTDDAGFFTDLGLDSLIAMEIIVQLEKRYRVKMDEEELPQISSLDNVYALLEDKLRVAA